MSNLLVQQGPSCWLFVVEAVAAAKKVDTESLRMVMYSYPDSDAVTDARLKHHNPKPGRRTVALELTAANLGLLVGDLVNYRDTANRQPAGDVIRMSLVERYNRQRLQSTASTAYIDYDGEDDGEEDTRTAKLSDVLGRYEKAHRCAQELHKLAQSGKDETAALLNTGHTVIDGGQQLSDVRLTLENQDLPSYTSISKRFRCTSQQRQQATVDFTNSAQAMEDTAHAVLLDAYDKANQIVTYKDPNYGNTKILVTLAQFQQMAGNSKIRLHPFFSSGMSKSALAKVLGA